MAGLGRSNSGVGVWAALPAAPECDAVLQEQRRPAGRSTKPGGLAAAAVVPTEGSPGRNGSSKRRRLDHGSNASTTTGKTKPASGQLRGDADSITGFVLAAEEAGLSGSSEVEEYEPPPTCPICR